MPDLLIELFSEEIPARMQARAADELKKRMTNGLVDAGLTYAGAVAHATPRRLALSVHELTNESPTVIEERKGPKVGAPDKAIEGFLRGAGVAMEDLEERETAKGQVYFAKITKPGRPADIIVAEVLHDVVHNFPWPKSMRWGKGALRWVRPLHSIIVVLTDEAGARVVDLEIDGVRIGDQTEGHRFMAPGRFAVTSFEDYETKLAQRFVVLDAEKRAKDIWADATNMAFANGLEVIEDKGLLAEVAGLVEYPVVLMGDIGDDFLDLPPEVLQTSMKEHQKFFSVRNPRTERIEKFITVANRTTLDQGKTILAGNEKVLAARLSDAKFFWENDLRIAKKDLNTWVQDLENVTFHNKLGSQGDRIRRIADLARNLAPAIGADPTLAEQAATLAKADLSSEMVYEFPELQGLMGRYYITASGRRAEIAAVSQEHYSPLGPSDEVPSAPVSVTVALADKLDTLTGFWAIGEKPTGSKDPFALRRAALGVIRLILENNARFELRVLVGQAMERHTSAVDADIIDDLLGFFHDRLKVLLRDQGVRHDVIDACLSQPGSDDLALLVKRAEALQAALDTEDGENLLQGFKRANNILTQAETKDGVEYSYGPDVKFAEDPTEVALFAALDQAEAQITPALKAEAFSEAMSAMAALRAPLDAFFEAVQVNSENQTLRRNRLNLLSRICSVCGAVADLGQIEG